jgi:hypothetical protein
VWALALLHLPAQAPQAVREAAAVCIGDPSEEIRQAALVYPEEAASIVARTWLCDG